MIEGLSDVIHALGHGGVVFVGMHVPNEIRGHAYEARSALGQPAGEQEEFAKRVHVVAIALVVVPPLADLGGVDQFEVS